MDDAWKILYKEAMNVMNPSEISEHIYVGSVGAALMTKDGNVMPPCGACREFMMQFKNGRQIEVMLNNEGMVKVLSDLMPDYCY